MKKLVALLLACLMLVAVFAGCKKEEPAPAQPTTSATDTVVEEPTEGKVFNIYAWNEEFKGFFEKYYTVPDGVTVNWIINPSDGGVYQQKLDAALMAQSGAADDDKIDMFLAEADYIGKYVESTATLGIDEIGYQNADTMYKYTIGAASDKNGVCKGVSFQCCPSAMIYRRSIAKEVFGTDDPAEIQELFSDWTKFEAAAEALGAKGYMITPNFAAQFRVFSNNCTKAWVDDSLKIQLDDGIKAWIDQTKVFMDKGYTSEAGLWDGSEQGVDGKAMCWFGPAWYFNFSMTGAQKETSGDWAICKGPQAHFWGGTWLLAAAGTDNKAMLKDIFETFTINEDVCTKLVENEAQYPNNTKVVEKFANDASYGSAFLGGQNDIALFASMAGDIKWENHTNYDQLLNEGIQTAMLDYFKGNVDYETAWNNFLAAAQSNYPELVID